MMSTKNPRRIRKAVSKVRAGGRSTLATAEKLLPGSGIYTPALSTRLVRTLNSNAGGQGLASRQSQYQISQVATSRKIPRAHV